MSRVEKERSEALEKDAVENPEVCPYCGYNIKIPPPVVDEEDVREYFRRMLAGEPFTKEYKYLNGDVSITLAELSVARTDRLVELVRDVADDETVVTHAFRAKFMASCVKLRMGSNVVINSAVEELNSLLELSSAYSEVVGKLPPTVMHLTDDALRDFSRLLDGAIQEAIASKSF